MPVRPTTSGISDTSLAAERQAAALQPNDFFIDVPHADVRAAAAAWHATGFDGNGSLLALDVNATAEWYAGSHVQAEQPTQASNLGLAR